jgi:glucose/arabinose dehydrogenase/PKD repeat protein
VARWATAFLILFLAGSFTEAAGVFQNQVLVSDLEIPVAIQFLPDQSVLIAELGGKILKASTQTWALQATPFLQLDNIGAVSGQAGLLSVVLDPAFATNRYFYVFYTRATPNRDRASRFTATADLKGTVPGSEFVIYEDTQTANLEHHGGAMVFGADGKLYITTGEHFQGSPAQDLTSSRGKLLRYNPDGTVPPDNPFYDGAGPNYDAIWCLGLRNPFRASFDAASGRIYIGDVGGNDYSTAREEVNVAARGANFGWPTCEGASCIPAPPTGHVPPFYDYGHAGRDASITGGIVYRGSQFPPEYVGNYFFGDYAQHWIKRLTINGSGALTGLQNFEPANGAPDGPTGSVVDLKEGPDGALYYVDLGDTDVSGKIRRIRYSDGNTPPTVVANATPTEGLAPLLVTFSSAGTADAEADPLSYSWVFGDGATSTSPNPTHNYPNKGPYTAQLTVSDGTNSVQSAPIAISVGIKPVAAITTPVAGPLFRGGDVIAYSGTGTDTEDGVLPASAFKWNIDFLHEGHIHPGLPVTGTKSGTFTIPTSGHDFHGNTRYRFTLTVTDSDGLTAVQSVTVFPDKTNITLDSSPRGMPLRLDSLPHVTPLVYDTLIGFQHQIDAPDLATPDYPFLSWSDGGARTHTITVPVGGATYFATYDTRTALNTVPPCRLFDSRAAIGPEAGAPRLAAGESRLVATTGKCQVPANAKSISVNVTITGPTAPGFVTLYPADQAAPATSNINFRPADTRANNAVVPLALDGTGIRVINGSTGTVDVIVDVNAWLE